ncbi:MAG: hypothetical protein PHN88_04675 [Ignavibacteria bacterium]|nr:hypothetical protein [Ignavibacteria bacterium]
MDNLSQQKDFEEIGHSGGKIELTKQPDGSLLLTIEGANPWAFSMFNLEVSFSGVILGKSNISGGYAPDAPPQERNTVQVMVISDRNGLWGRICPICRGYFRTNFPGDPTFCPYCDYKGDGIRYLTKNQIQFIEAYFNAYINALINGIDVTIDLDELTSKLEENNKSPWVYTEEKQQTQVYCPNCKTTFDILGEYGRCPQCALPNAKQIVIDKFNNLESDFINKEKTINDRSKREMEWKSFLLNSVSVFDGLGHEMRRNLLFSPYTPKRRADLECLSFQNILKVNDCFKNWFGFEILSGITNSDKIFLNIMFNKRHLFTHNNGIVDSEYLKNTDDKKVKSGQLIRLDSKEIKRFLLLVKCISINFIEGVVSIS